MGIQSAKSLSEALGKAIGVGVVEDTFQIGDCEVVLRNLRPDEYEAVLDECKELEDLPYINKFQEGHICRAVQELNGVSFREIDFVECEEPDPKKPGQMRTIKRERHEWLRKNVLNTWSKEAIYTSYRKFSDVVTTAETQARKGVTFMTPDETAEEQYRRTVSQLKELEGELPPALIASILLEHGYVPYTEPQDRAALDKLDEIAKPDGDDDGGSTPPAPAPPPVAASPTQASLAESLQRRRPLNQEVVDVPVTAPIVTPPPAAPVMSRRSAEFLAAEAEFDPDFRAAAPVGVVPPGALVAPEFLSQAGALPVREAAVLEKPQQGHSDPQAFSQLVDRPVAPSLNPKFRRQG
jgi:hypothetical protein